MNKKITTPDGRGQNDKVIGIVGVAPWSTIDFLKTLYSQIDATKDWHFPRVICDINTKIPSRGRHFELGEEDFSPAIKKNIESLKTQGAEIVVVTCNTAHVYYKNWSRVDGVEVINIVESTIDRAKALGSERVTFLSGRALRGQGLYQDAIHKTGLSSIELNDNEAELVYQIILDVKKNNQRIEDVKRLELERLFKKLQDAKVDTVILGCTELGVLQILAESFFKNVVDSNEALARVLIESSKND